MKIVALGTGTSQGVPIIGCKCPVCLSSNKKDKRLRSSIYLEIGGVKVLVDIGPDFRHQFLSNNLETIDLILITHEHNDHVIGLDDIRAINYTQQKSIPIFAESNVAVSLKERFPYAFTGKTFPGVPRLELNLIDSKPFMFRDLEIIPIRVMHGKLPILGFRFEDFAYITDANDIEEKELEKLRGLDVLILNALHRTL